MQAARVDADHEFLETFRHNALTQTTVTQHIRISSAGSMLYPVRVRYAWLAELDLMAQLARLRLREKWSNWRRDPLTADSGEHISIYGLDEVS